MSVDGARPTRILVLGLAHFGRGEFGDADLGSAHHRFALLVCLHLGYFDVLFGVLFADLGGLDYVLFVFLGNLVLDLCYLLFIEFGVLGLPPAPVHNNLPPILRNKQTTNRQKPPNFPILVIIPDIPDGIPIRERAHQIKPINTILPTECGILDKPTSL